MPSVMTDANARRTAWAITAITIIFMAVGGFFVVQGVHEWMLAKASAAWPTVTGTVTHSEVTRHTSTSKGRTRTSYNARIEFDYEIDGVTIRGDRLTYKVTSSSQSGAQETVDRHPVGSTVTVSYDPDDRTRAVLEPGWDWSNAIPVGVGLFAIAFAGFIRWLVLRAMRKAVQRMKDLQAQGIDPDSIPDDAQLAKAQPDATAVEPSPTGSRDSRPVELKPTFHDDLPGSR
jgi:hypothetical protein